MNQIKRVWIPADSFYAEEESCSTRDVQVVLASDYERQVAELRVQLRLANIDQANTQAEVAELTAKLKAKDSALEFAKAAIGDAIYLEEGLDGETGQRVQRLIVQALERGTFDVPGELGDFLVKRERAAQDQIADLTTKLDAAEERLSAMEQDRDEWRATCNSIQVQRDDLTRRLEKAQREKAETMRWGQDNNKIAWQNAAERDALQAKLEEAQARAQRPPEPHESVCHACDGSGWVSS